MLEVTDKAVALLIAISPEMVGKLPPAERRRLADACRRVARIADPEGSKTQDDIINEAREATEPRSGVLAALKNGQPRHGG